MSKRKAVEEQVEKVAKKVKAVEEQVEKVAKKVKESKGPLDDTIAVYKTFYSEDSRKKLDGLEKMAKDWDADSTQFDNYMIKALIEWFCGPGMGRDKVEFYHYEHCKREASQTAAIGLRDWGLAKFTFLNILLTRLVHEPKDNIANAKDEIANAVAKALCRMAFSWGKFAVPVKVDGRELNSHSFIPTGFITQDILKKVIIALIEKMNF